MDKSKFTHKGWWWFCPVYLNADAKEPTVVPRHWSLDLPYELAGALEATRIFLSCLFIPRYEPSFMILITGKIE